MKCPECDYENDQDALYCEQCGAKLQEKYPITASISQMSKKASRVELFIRIVYGFVLGIIAGIWGFFVGIVSFIHWFYILILGKRHESLWVLVTAFLRFAMRMTGYIALITDERPPISGEKKEYPLKFSSVYEENASRLELFIRIVYGFVLGLIASIWGFFAEIAAAIQWFYILILGKRHGSLWEFIAGYIRFYYRLEGYMSLLTDERPPITGEEL